MQSPVMQDFLDTLHRFHAVFGNALENTTRQIVPIQPEDAELLNQVVTCDDLKSLGK